MKYIFFDTETTGLPVDKAKSSIEYRNNWPDIVSISWIVSIDGIFSKKETYIVKPEHWIIPEDSVKIHGITHQNAMARGIALKRVMDAFKADLMGCDVIVAHNLDFDMNVVFNAFLWRLHEDPRSWWPKVRICTMRLAINELKIPSKYPTVSNPYKFPSLNELYVATFNQPAPGGAHSADRDTEVLFTIFLKRWQNKLKIDAHGHFSM